MLPEALMALASLAGNTVVAAAATDAWEAARHKFARLLGRGDPERERLAERRLTETREQLTAAGADLELARASLETRWVGWLADLLEEDPGAEADLRALVEELRAAVSAADRSVAAGRDMNITASGGGFAAGVVHGDVTPPGPTSPGPARS